MQNAQPENNTDISVLRQRSEYIRALDDRNLFIWETVIERPSWLTANSELYSILSKALALGSVPVNILKNYKLVECLDICDYLGSDFLIKIILETVLPKRTVDSFPINYEIFRFMQMISDVRNADNIGVKILAKHVDEMCDWELGTAHNIFKEHDLQYLHSKVTAVENKTMKEWASYFTMILFTTWMTPHVHSPDDFAFIKHLVLSGSTRIRILLRPLLTCPYCNNFHMGAPSSKLANSRCCHLRAHKTCRDQAQNNPCQKCVELAKFDEELNQS